MKSAYDNGYKSYKDVKIKLVNGIEVNNFRTLKNRYLNLGNKVTLISGKNGTMKSTLLGLIAHPFSSPTDAKDAFGNPLKTDMRDVFYLSLEKDKNVYNYKLMATTTENITFAEPIRVYPREKENRFRVTVGKDNKKGKGNFSLNTSYINLKRLFPIIDTNAIKQEMEEDSGLNKFISAGYMRIIQREAFAYPHPISDGKAKTTFGPMDSAGYDFKSISSGEDNIGHILNKMYAFIKNKSEVKECLQGILCIDEFEASLHPVAQINLFDYILTWAQTYNIQVVLTTHSLYLIQHAILKREKMSNKEDIAINMISTAFVDDKNYNIIKNPTYEEAYKELTFKDVESISEVYKINLISEDDMAEAYLKKIISKREVLAKLNFIHSLTENGTGNSCSGLKAILKNGDKLLQNSIVLFDADVQLKDLKNVKASYLRLPSVFEMPLEKEIAKFIYDLNGADEFFKLFKKERDSFLNDFSYFEITNLSDVDEIKKMKVTKFKNWAKSDKRFKQYVTHYIKRNSVVMNVFKERLIDEINTKLVVKSFPKITL